MQLAGTRSFGRVIIKLWRASIFFTITELGLHLQLIAFCKKKELYRIIYYRKKVMPSRNRTLDARVTGEHLSTEPSTLLALPCGGSLLYSFIQTLKSKHKPKF